MTQGRDKGYDARQKRDKGLDDEGREKGMTQGYDARAASTRNILRTLNWHAAIWERPENYLLKIGKTTEAENVDLHPTTPIPQGPGPGV